MQIRSKIEYIYALTTLRHWILVYTYQKNDMEECIILLMYMYTTCTRKGNCIVISLHFLICSNSNCNLQTTHFAIYNYWYFVVWFIVCRVCTCIFNMREYSYASEHVATFCVWRLVAVTSSHLTQALTHNSIVDGDAVMIVNVTTFCHFSNISLSVGRHYAPRTPIPSPPKWRHNIMRNCIHVFIFVFVNVMSQYFTHSYTSPRQCDVTTFGI